MLPERDRGRIVPILVSFGCKYGLCYDSRWLPITLNFYWTDAMLLCSACTRWPVVAIVFIGLICFSWPVQAQENEIIPIQQIQSQLTNGDDSAWAGKAVTVEGTVTAVYGSLFFIQSKSGDSAWSGIAVYQSGHGTTLGDQVRVSGTVAEYYDLTEIQSAKVEVLASNQPLPTPVKLATSEVGQEKWEGVLVQVSDVRVTALPNQYGEWRVRGKTGGALLIDDKGVAITPEIGQSFANVTGVMDHAFGSYRLLPRTVADVSGFQVAEAPLPEDALPIFSIQGTGISTPITGRVTTYGLVTGVTESGFYLQDPTGDKDPTTSDGLFVYTGRPPVIQSGDCALVEDGDVQEYYEKTELTQPKRVRKVTQCGKEPVGAVDLPLAQIGVDPISLFEPYEGMLVNLPPFQAIVQGPTKRFASGETEIALLPITSTQTLSATTPSVRVFQDDSESVMGLLFLSSLIGDDLPALAWGDVVSSATPIQGILDYNFGKYQLLILPDQEIDFAQGPGVHDQEPMPDPESFTVCTFNLWGLGQGSDQFPNAAEYALQLRRRARTIAETLHGCTIIGLQETGKPEDGERLAQLLSLEFGLPYTATALAGPNTRSLTFPLTNSLLTRTDRVQIEQARLVQGCSQYNFDVGTMRGSCKQGEVGLFNRPPLVVDLVVSGNWAEPYPLTVIVNHFKSKRGDESANLVQRMLQARHVATIAQSYLDRDQDAHVVVMGDLNDYYESAPLKTLQRSTRPDLLHTFDFISPEDRYTYLYNGASQVLDHILISQGMLTEFGGVSPAHVNADFPAPSPQQEEEIPPEAGNLRHSSDHDPVMMTLRPAGAGWIGGRAAAPGLAIQVLDSGGKVAGSALSDQAGQFRIWDLVPGTYQVTYMAPPSYIMASEVMTVPVRVGVGLFFEPAMVEPLTK